MISCIIPSFNRIKFLENQILSLKEQSYKDIEIIVVDDGSTQDYSIVKKMSDVKYIRLEENSSSVSIPRAIGISHSTRKYIAPIDDDIINLPNKFEKLLHDIETKNTLLSYGDRYTQYQNRVVLDKFGKLWDPRKEHGIDGSQYIYLNIYDKIPYVFSRRACDYHTAQAIANYNYKFSYIGEPVSVYVWHTSNRSLDSSNLDKKIYPSKFSKYFKKLYYSLPEEI